MKYKEVNRIITTALKQYKDSRLDGCLDNKGNIIKENLMDKTQKELYVESQKVDEVLLNLKGV